MASKVKIVLIICFLSLVKISSSFTCPQGCQCSGKVHNDEVAIECEDIDIYTILCPSLHSAKYLRVTHSRGNAIKESMFAEYPSLRTLILSQNNLDKVEEKAFRNLKNLQLLDIARNNIRTLPPGVFTDIDTTVTLILSQNKINSITPKIFDNLSNLKDLQLDNNGIEEIQCGSLKPLITLDTLDLSNNKLQHIPSCAFEGMKSLRVLRLSQNKLTSLDENIFKPLVNLITLHLSGNSFTVLPKFDGLSNLQYIDIADNELPLFPYLGNMKSLRMLSLSGNPITKIAKDDLAALKSLKTLHLNRMGSLTEIESGSFDNLVNMEILTLQENNPGLKIHQSLFNKFPKANIIINGKEPVEKDYVIDKKKLENQMKGMAPGGVAIAPNVKIIEIDNPNDHGSFSDQLKDLTDYYQQQSNNNDESDKDEKEAQIMIPEEEMNPTNKLNQRKANSYSSMFNKLSAEIEEDEMKDEAVINEQNTENKRDRSNVTINKGLLGGMIAVVSCGLVVVVGILYRGRRQKSKFRGYTPVSREDLETMDLLSKQTAVVTSYGTNEI